MKRKAKRLTPKGHHIPTKSEDVGVIDAVLKDKAKFKKPSVSIDKFISKGDTVE